jgi:adenylosuccinate synthase
MDNSYLIYDLQFGSTGKGLVAGNLAKKMMPEVCVTAFGPNAGHTYIDENDVKWVHTQLPNGIVSPDIKYAMLGPGSYINMEKLQEEIEHATKQDIRLEIRIHENATVVQPHHVAEESGPMTAIGSTKKGMGAAMVEKIRRNPRSAIIAKHFALDLRKLGTGSIKVKVISHSDWVGKFDEFYERNFRIQIEGAQGYSLGIHSGFYPHCTSRECTPNSILSECGIPGIFTPTRVGVMRTFPIRVANRYDEDGNMVGWSGPCYDDQKEITFEELGVEPEKTTVTKLTRRIFTFSKEQYEEALLATNPHFVFCTFLDYLRNNEEFFGMVEEAAKDVKVDVEILGYSCGPTPEHVSFHDLSDFNFSVRGKDFK